jgi:aryl-alcohol dehydrogenase-like predicted oxidoreductase
MSILLLLELLLERCLDLDVTCIDTPNVYGGGNNGWKPADPRRAARMKEGST